MNVALRRAACSVVVLLGSAALLFAQAQPGQPRAGQPRQPGQPGQPGAQAQQLEPSIITLTIIENNKEIALGQLGEQTSENPDIKHFCQMIVKDHSDFVQKLQERSGAGGRSPRLGTAPGTRQPTETAAGQPARPGAATAQTRPGTTESREGATQPRRDAAAEPRTDETRTAAGQGRELREGQRVTVAKPVIGNQPGAQLLQLHHEIAEQSLESARDDAKKHSGAEFDKHFMAAQVVAHKGMLDKLQVFERHVSPQTAQLFADAQETTKKHLKEAESICQRLEKEGSSEKAGATERRTERENQ